MVAGIEVMPVRNLKELIIHFLGDKKITPLRTIEIKNLVETATPDFDMEDVVGQESAKRALVVAAAGDTICSCLVHLVLVKQCCLGLCRGIMSPMTEEESMEVTRVYSAAG